MPCVGSAAPFAMMVRRYDKRGLNLSTIENCLDGPASRKIHNKRGRRAVIQRALMALVTRHARFLPFNKL